MLLTAAVEMALIAVKCFSSAPVTYTPIFDPSSAKDGTAIYDSSPSAYTRLEGAIGDAYGDAFEPNNNFREAVDMTPDEAYLDQSYYIMAPTCHLRDGDVDWFTFTILADSLVTVKTVLHLGYLTNENAYRLNIYYSDIYIDDPNGYVLFSSLTDLYEFSNLTNGFDESFTLRAGYYLVELIGGKASFNYDFFVRAQYMKREPLDITYVSNFENAGAAYWESDFFPFHKFDVKPGTFREHSLNSERFVPNCIYEPMVNKAIEITGSENFMTNALIVWDDELGEIIGSELNAMIDYYKAELMKLNNDIASIKTTTTVGGVLLTILSKGFSVASSFFQTSNAAVSMAANILLTIAETKVQSLKDSTTRLALIANLLTDMVPAAEQRNGDSNIGELEVVIIPLMWSSGYLQYKQRVGYHVPEAIGFNVNDYFRAENYMIPAKPKNALSRGNFWVLERGAVNSIDGFSGALKWHGSGYSYRGYVNTAYPTVQTPYGTIGLMDNRAISDGFYAFSCLIRGGYDHQVIVFLPNKTGTYLARCTQGDELEIDVFHSFPTTISCDASIARPTKSSFLGQSFQFEAIANRPYFIRIHTKGWGGSINNGIPTALLVQEKL